MMNEFVHYITEQYIIASVCWVFWAACNVACYFLQNCSIAYTTSNPSSQQGTNRNTEGFETSACYWQQYISVKVNLGCEDNHYLGFWFVLNVMSRLSGITSGRVSSEEQHDIKPSTLMHACRQTHIHSYGVRVISMTGCGIWPQVLEKDWQHNI